MIEIIKQSLLDETGKGSSPRVNSFLATIAGILFSAAVLLMHGLGVPNMAAISGVVLTAFFGKSATDTWAAQLKSSKVLTSPTSPVSLASSTVSTTTTTQVTSPETKTTSPSPAEKPTEKDQKDIERPSTDKGV